MGLFDDPFGIKRTKKALKNPFDIKGQVDAGLGLGNSKDMKKKNRRRAQSALNRLRSGIKSDEFTELTQREFSAAIPGLERTIKSGGASPFDPKGGPQSVAALNKLMEDARQGKGKFGERQAIREKQRASEQRKGSRQTVLTRG